MIDMKKLFDTIRDIKKTGWSRVQANGGNLTQDDVDRINVIIAGPLHGSRPDKSNPYIAMISAELIKVACPSRSLAELQQWVEPIRKACIEFEINTIRRISAFIAQMAHESICFTALNENMNYTAQRMAQVWPSRYAVNPRAKDKQPNALAIRLAAEGPEAIANHTYA